ncbi:DNA-binding response OmpR family regulator [Brevundimonas alba]|uniref:DNA-binding response OmpR family regulator n=2 Tax=Brevundimonas alba TaxID=74314 RepID=A0A7X6BNT2_9CAUL|nr:DNA-binding response OmpR family regulator [Brevundimonas alba]
MYSSLLQVPTLDERSISIGLSSLRSNSNDAALRLALEGRGAVVNDWHPTGGAVDDTRSPEPDVLILTAKVLDSGLSLLIQKIGRQASPYLIVLLEEGDVVDRIVALELGADDFLQHPVDPREVLARAKRLLRRGAQRSTGLLANDNGSEAGEPWVLNVVSRLLRSPAGAVCGLSRGDIQLIDSLTNPAGVLAMNMDSTEANNLRVSVSRLRRKFRRNSGQDLPIRNIWGQGYTFNAQLKRIGSSAAHASGTAAAIRA